MTTNERTNEIKAVVLANQQTGKHPFDGLESSDIAEYNRSLMFGDNDEAFPDQSTWAMMTD